MKKNSMIKRKAEYSQIDKKFRKLMLGLGILAGVLFVCSLIAMVEFPDLFKPIAYAMIGTAILFLVVRVIFSYRRNSKVGAK